MGSPVRSNPHKRWGWLDQGNSHGTRREILDLSLSSCIQYQLFLFLMKYYNAIAHTNKFPE